MGKTKIVTLSETQRQELEEGYRHGTSHAFRQRCHMILLKSEKRSALQVAAILGCCEMVVNTWLARYATEGLPGLHTRPGQGRTAILQPTDLEQVKTAVKESRQRLAQVKEGLAQELGKQFSVSSLKRFVKKMVVVEHGLENGSKGSR